ncbi:hypothetical protein DFH11DRAFT_1608278 [Phellopilus nigrolimitatus]|nr:hypothetical protein DFH11DRAFT_1608278 [Phellopilus nigrolimitatus]
MRGSTPPQPPGLSWPPPIRARASTAHPTCPFPLRRGPRSLAPRAPSPPPPASSVSPRVPLHNTERPIPTALAAAAPSLGTMCAVLALARPGTTTSPKECAARSVFAADGAPASRHHLRWCKHSRRAPARQRHCYRQRMSRCERARACTGCRG